MLSWWCGTGRLCAAQTLRTPRSCAVHKANRLRCVTLTLRKGHTFHWSRSLCGPADSALVHPRKQQGTHPVQSWDCVVWDWRHLDRASRSGRSSEGGHLDVISTWKRLHSSGSRGQPLCHGLFPGNRELFNTRTSTSTRTRIMHSRASSTAAATKRSDVSEKPAITDPNTTEQKLKETSATSSSTEKAPEEPEPEGGKPSKTQQLKKVFKEYGAVGVSFHIGISLMSLGMFYLLISSGIDMAAILCKVGFSETVVRSKMAAGTSTFVLAYAIHKLFAPVRMSITLVSVPLIVRYFRKTGLFKPPTPTP
ncbi:hypothetical protein JOB18_017726 [Solea senegalensis]|uniref:DUF1279 domain-containing protein n=1 Tax=Solea senegalensis TaxID=28829 RepID=A0AAV6QJF3_SOLSE|nr:protein FAM210B, mitochondrial [Solea senegalensis]KAG7493871.1 hypothetical protein JOB18_017726 [Solea senegalensis]